MLYMNSLWKILKIVYSKLVNRFEHGFSVCYSVLFIAGLIIFTAFCSDKYSDSKNSPNNTNSVKLPPPRHDSKVSIESSIFNRHSIRRFIQKPVSLKDISQLLWAGGGKTIDGTTGATRAYASAGGVYPLNFYLIPSHIENLANGIYKYVWKEHKLDMLKKGDFISKLLSATYNSSLKKAYIPACIIITAKYSKTTSHYGERGRLRYVPMDAGGSGQNISLQAQALGLGTYLIGAFEDDNVRKVLDIKDDEVPLYILPIGKY